MKEKKCTKCGNSEFRRINRDSFMLREIMPRFGYYPWECVFCRVRRLFKDDGRRPSKRGMMSGAAALFVAIAIGMTLGC